jgi:uncharacterized lipoprotein NlpE involved in copper resistance
MKKIMMLLIAISFLILILYGCNNMIPQNNEVDTEQTEGELSETGNSPGPAPNSGDGVSDGPGWEKKLPETTQLPK